MLQVFHIPPNCTKSVLISLKHTDFFFLYKYGRLLYIPEMYCHCTCQSPKDSNIKVGNICLSTALQSPHLSGMYILVLIQIDLTS